MDRTRKTKLGLWETFGESDCLGAGASTSIGRRPAVGAGPGPLAVGRAGGQPPRRSPEIKFVVVTRMPAGTTTLHSSARHAEQIEETGRNGRGQNHPDSEQVAEKSHGEHSRGAARRDRGGLQPEEGQAGKAVGGGSVHPRTSLTPRVALRTTQPPNTRRWATRWLSTLLSTTRTAAGT